jgi:cation diffusion facilitator family transporter
MHSHSIHSWQHEHVFLGARHGRNERRTWIVVSITLATMVIEIVGGGIYHSMALVADGWHMASHAAALAIAAFGYRFARRHAHNSRFSFGTGKFGELAGFASAVSLALVSLYIATESIARFFNPAPISFDEAIAIAALGLSVNLLCAWLLRDDHSRHHHDDHDRHHHDDYDDHHHGHDHNLKAAYVHVLSDALTSVLAIVALLLARTQGWVWMDAAVGVLGAGVIAIWAWGLIRASGAVLLDVVPDAHMLEAARDRLEVEGDKVSDLHLWRLGPGHSALIAAIVSDRPQEPEVYKKRLSELGGLSHITIEIHACQNHKPLSAAA